MGLRSPAFWGARRCGEPGVGAQPGATGCLPQALRAGGTPSAHPCRPSGTTARSYADTGAAPRGGAQLGGDGCR
ncbi:hypothetical protein C3489_31575, partial [Streptomyces sp. Ru71]